MLHILLWSIWWITLCLVIFYRTEWVTFRSWKGRRSASQCRCAFRMLQKDCSVSSWTESYVISFLTISVPFPPIKIFPHPPPLFRALSHLRAAQSRSVRSSTNNPFSTWFKMAETCWTTSICASAITSSMELLLWRCSSKRCATTKVRECRECCCKEVCCFLFTWSGRF